MNSSQTSNSLALSCANQYFSVDGEPISPKIIKALTGDLGDMDDPIISIDLIPAQHSSRFCCIGDVSIIPLRNKPAYIYFQKKEESFGYKHIGKTKSGVHVIYTSYSGGGSGIFNSIYFFTITLDRAFTLDLKSSTVEVKRPRLILKNIGSINLGDRWVGDIYVKGDILYLGKDKGIYAGSNGGGNFSKDVKDRKITIPPPL